MRAERSFLLRMNWFMAVIFLIGFVALANGQLHCSADLIIDDFFYPAAANAQLSQLETFSSSISPYGVIGQERDIMLSLAPNNGTTSGSVSAIVENGVLTLASSDFLGVVHMMIQYDGADASPNVSMSEPILGDLTQNARKNTIALDFRSSTVPYAVIVQLSRVTNGVVETQTFSSGQIEAHDAPQSTSFLVASRVAQDASSITVDISVDSTQDVQVVLETVKMTCVDCDGAVDFAPGTVPETWTLTDSTERATVERLPEGHIQGQFAFFTAFPLPQNATRPSLRVDFGSLYRFVEFTQFAVSSGANCSVGPTVEVLDSSSNVLQVLSPGELTAVTPVDFEGRVVIDSGAEVVRGIHIVYEDYTCDGGVEPQFAGIDDVRVVPDYVACPADAGPTGVLRVHVFMDRDGDNQQGAFETAVLNAVVVVIEEASGNSQSLATNSDGEAFFVVAVGNATISVDETSISFGNAQPVAPFSVSVPRSEMPAFETASVGVILRGVVQGVIFLDENLNGAQDAGEVGLSGVTIRIVDSLGATVTQVTNDAGAYSVLVAVGQASFSIDAPFAIDPLTITSSYDAPVVVSRGFSPGISMVMGSIFADANGNGLRDDSERGFAGVSVTIENSDGTTMTKTDSTGRYSLVVPAGPVKITVDSDRLPVNRNGTAGQDVVDLLALPGVPLEILNGFQINFELGDPISLHVFLDRDGNGAQGPFEQNLMSAQVSVTDSSGLPRTLITDADGMIFTYSAVGNVSLVFNENTLPPGVSTSPLHLADGDSVSLGLQQTGIFRMSFFQDFNRNGALDAGEPPLPGVQLEIVDSLGQAHIVVADSDGFLEASVPAGPIEIGLVDNALVLLHRAVFPRRLETSYVVVAGRSVSAGVFPIHTVALVTGTVFADSDEPDFGLAGVVVRVADSTGATVTAVTNAYGQYAASVFGGEVTVSIDENSLPATGWTQTVGANPSQLQAVTGQDQQDSDGFQLDMPVATIAIRVFSDRNGDARVSPFEPNLVGIPVELSLDSSTSLLFTDADGLAFRTVVAGDFTVRVDDSSLPAGSVLTRTSPVPTSLAPYSLLSLEFGYQVRGEILGHLFQDNDGDGMQSSGETSLENVTVIIRDATGEMFMVSTDSEGRFRLIVAAGRALVDVNDGNLPAGSGLTIGEDPTELIVDGEFPVGLVNGYQLRFLLRGRVFDDTNRNGASDSSETGFPGVFVRVFDSLGGTHVLTTGGTGNFSLAVVVGTTNVNVDVSSLPDGASLTSANNPATFQGTAGSTIVHNVGFRLPVIVQPPIAHDDVATTSRGQTVIVSVALNDVDPDGDLDVTTVSIAVPPHLGEAVVSSVDGSITYTPSATFVSGYDYLSYVVCDATSNCDSALLFVYIDVNPAVCSNAEVVVCGSSPVQVPIPDNAQLVGRPTTFGYFDPIQREYRPSPGLAQSGEEDIVAYKVCDALTGFQCQRCQVRLVYSATCPAAIPMVVARDDFFNTPVGTAVTMNVLANDQYVLGGVIVGPAQGGNVTTDSDFNVVFSPETNLLGQATIQYTVCNSAGCDSAVITINVGPFCPQPQSCGTVSTFSIQRGDIFSIPDLSITNLLTVPTAGSLAGSVYTSNKYVGSSLDFFTFETCAELGQCKSCCVRTVQIQITDVDVPPVAESDTVFTGQEVPVTFNVIRNDYALSAHPLLLNAYAVVQSTPVSGGGTVSLLDGGVFRFTPDAGFRGVATMGYTLCTTADNLCSSATVSIFVGSALAPLQPPTEPAVVPGCKACDCPEQSVSQAPNLVGMQLQQAKCTSVRVNFVSGPLGTIVDQSANLGSPIVLSVGNSTSSGADVTGLPVEQAFSSSVQMVTFVSGPLGVVVSQSGNGETLFIGNGISASSAAFDFDEVAQQLTFAVGEDQVGPPCVSKGCCCASGASVLVPYMLGLPVEQALPLLCKEKLESNIVYVSGPLGSIMSQHPAPLSTVKSGHSVVTLSVGNGNVGDSLYSATVPKLVGQPLAAALQLAQMGEWTVRINWVNGPVIGVVSSQSAVGDSSTHPRDPHTLVLGVASGI